MLRGSHSCPEAGETRRLILCGARCEGGAGVTGGCRWWCSFSGTGTGRDCGRGRGCAGVAYFSVLTCVAKGLGSAFLGLI